MTIRAMVPTAEEPLRSLAQHVLRLQDEAGFVVLVAANRPWANVQPVFEAEGVDFGRLFVLDAISCVNGYVQEARKDGILFLQSPTMLEMIAMRTEQIVARNAGAHVVLDNLNALTLYNGLGPVQEFSHYLANRLRAMRSSGDLLILDSDKGTEIRAAVDGFIDGEATMQELA